MPNPQCEMLLRRYGCGVLLRGHDCPSMSEAVSLADARYLDGCARAVRAELNWPTQTAKLDRL